MGNKSSGGTRRQGPKKANAPQRSYSDIVDGIVKAIESGRLDNMSNGDLNEWLDTPTEEREIMLMQAGFTGALDVTQDPVEPYFMKGKDDMLTALTEDIVNEWEFGNVLRDSSWTIGFKDGTIIDISEMESPERPAGIGRYSSKSLYAAAGKAIGNKSKIAFVINNNAYSTDYWHDSTNGWKQLKNYTGWEKWKDGRGEKKRDYIQDDWL